MGKQDISQLFKGVYEVQKDLQIADRRLLQLRRDAKAVLSTIPGVDAEAVNEVMETVASNIYETGLMCEDIIDEIDEQLQIAEENGNL